MRLFQTYATLQESGTLTLNKWYQIKAQSKIDFTLYGAPGLDVGTVFMCSGVDGEPLGYGSYTAVVGKSYKILAIDDADFFDTIVPHFSYGPVLESGTPTIGVMYEIVLYTGADIDFTNFGAASNTVGTQFVLAEGISPTGVPTLTASSSLKAVLSPAVGTVFKADSAGTVILSATDSLCETCVLSTDDSVYPVTSRMPVIFQQPIIEGAMTFYHRHTGAYTAGSLAIGVNTEGALAGETTPAGFNVTTTETPGEGVPDLTGAIAALRDINLSAIVFAWPDSQSAASVAAEIARRDGWAVQKYGQGYTCAHNTNDTTLCALGDTLNAKELTIWGAKNDYTPACESAAAKAAAFLARMAINPACAVGEIEDTYTMPGPDRSLDYTIAEKQLLLEHGITPESVTDDAQRSVKLGRVRTTMTTDDSGNPTLSYLDLGNTRYCPAFVISYKKTMLMAKYSSFSLVSNATTIGDNVDAVRPMDIENDVIGYHHDCVSFGWCQDSDGYAQKVKATVDPLVPGRLLIYDPDVMAAGLVQIFYTLDFTLKA